MNSQEYRAEAIGWGKLAVRAIQGASRPARASDPPWFTDRELEAVSAARAAWRNALLYDAAREGRLYE